MRKEGRFMRWLASSLDTTFHTGIIEEGEKSWPEATVLFYVWTGPEAWCTSIMAKTCAGLYTKHLSLHCDGIKTGVDDYHIPQDILCEHMQEHMISQGSMDSEHPKTSLFAHFPSSDLSFSS